jgi:hypothetical protein
MLTRKGFVVVAFVVKGYRVLSNNHHGACHAPGSVAKRIAVDMVSVGRAASVVAAFVSSHERGIAMFDQVKAAVKTAAARTAALLGIIQKSEQHVATAVEQFDDNVAQLRGRVEQEAQTALDKLSALSDAIDESVAAFEGIGETDVEDYSTWTVAELRDECKARGYSITGLRKAELIELLS